MGYIDSPERSPVEIPRQVGRFLAGPVQMVHQRIEDSAQISCLNFHFGVIAFF